MPEIAFGYYTRARGLPLHHCFDAGQRQWRRQSVRALKCGTPLCAYFHPPTASTRAYSIHRRRPAVLHIFCLNPSLTPNCSWAASGLLQKWFAADCVNQQSVLPSADGALHTILCLSHFSRRIAPGQQAGFCRSGLLQTASTRACFYRRCTVAVLLGSKRVVAEAVCVLPSTDHSLSQPISHTGSLLGIKRVSAGVA